MMHGVYRTLLGDPQKLVVERAHMELRSGRPVLMLDGDERLVVSAFENLGHENFATLKSIGHEPRLVLTAARLRWLKHDRASGGVLDVANRSLSELERIVTGENEMLEDGARLASSTEQAALELVRMSLLLPAAVVTNAKSLAPLAIADLASVDAKAVRLYQDNVAADLKIISRAPVPLEGVESCEFVVFRGGDGLREQIAVIIGKLQTVKPALLRIHSACLTGDLFGSLKCDCGDQLRGTVKRMAQDGGGIILYLDQEGRGNGIANKIRAYCLQNQGYDTYDADELLGFENDHRRFEIAASMLRLLGVSVVQLMTNNPNKIKALEDAGLNVVATQRVFARTNGHNSGYLAAKRDRAGHLFEQDAFTDVKAVNES